MGMMFTPFVMETTGGFGDKALKLIDRIGRRYVDMQNLTSEDGIQRVRKSISFAYQKRTAGMLIRRHGAC